MKRRQAKIQRVKLHHGRHSRPTMTTDYWPAPALAQAYNRTPVWSLGGMGSLGECCGNGSIGCCDMVEQLRQNGYDSNGNDLSGLSGLGADTAQIAQQVQSTLNLIPGASGVTADQSKVGLLYDVFTNATASQLDQALTDYKRKVAYLNAALKKIDARRDDLALRTKLLAEHARVATSTGNYGRALIDQINRYNEMVSQFSGTVAGKITIPDTVPVTGLPKLDVPTLSGLSGMNGLGLVQIPIATVVLVGIVALLLWKFSDLIHDYMVYDLKLKGIKSGLDQEYEGFSGMVQQFVDKTGGSILSTVLLVGAGVVAFLFLKNYMTKKGVIGSAPAKASVKEAIKELEAVPIAKPAPASSPEPTVKQAVSELASIAQGA
jgi:hypothetical protein